MKGVEATATLNTSGSVDATCEATDLLTKGLVAKLEASTASNGGLLSKALATFDFKQELFTAKASYEVYKGDAHAALSTAALAGFTLGGSVDYSAQKGALTKYAAAGQFVQPEFTLCAKVSEAVGKPAGMTFAGSYFHKVSSEMQVGAELSKAMNKSDVALAFGCAYKLDKDTTVKSKVDSDGMLFGSYKAKISPMSKPCSLRRVLADAVLYPTTDAMDAEWFPDGAPGEMFERSFTLERRVQRLDNIPDGEPSVWLSWVRYQDPEPRPPASWPSAAARVFWGPAPRPRRRPASAP